MRRTAPDVTPAPAPPRAPFSASAFSAGVAFWKVRGGGGLRDRYSTAGRNPCPSGLLNPCRSHQGRHAGERSFPKRAARRRAGQPRERRLPGPRQAGPDPLQQHFRGQRYQPLAGPPRGGTVQPRTVTLALGGLCSSKAVSSGRVQLSTEHSERGGPGHAPLWDAMLPSSSPAGMGGVGHVGADNRLKY